MVFALVLGLFMFSERSACSKIVVFRSGEMTAGAKITLKEARAQQVWEMFRQVSRIPRCSKNEERIIEWLRDFARSRNLACRSDAVGNIVIELPPTKGCEDAPAVVLQSHVDMVCEKSPDSKHDFSTDPIEIMERDGWVCAEGTTLGADNGLGMALALEANSPHPKLELLFTVDEETGLTGANALQPDFITGRYLINLDGEDESFIVGCAGGEQTEIQLTLEWAPVSESFDRFNLKVSGLQGGHSGIDIAKQRANAIVLLSRAIQSLQKRFDLSICRIEGGRAANAIPRDATAVVCIASSELDAIKRFLSDIESSFKQEFSTTDPALKVELAAQSTGCCEKVFSPELGKRIVGLLLGLPNGVYRVSQKFDGVVETSSNLARIEADAKANFIRIVTSHRSFESSSMAELTGEITAAANLAGAEARTSGGYPSWRPDINSALLGRAKEVHKQLRGKEPDVRVIHAGLECAVIGRKFPDIEMISVGPTIRNAHSPQECVDIASVDNSWLFLLSLLSSLK